MGVPFHFGAPALELRWSRPAGGLVGYARLAGRAATARRLGLAPGTDDELVLAAAWRRWGPDAPGRLAGQFAFAVPAGDGLVLGRDQLGQVPLYWARIRGGVVASVDLEAVLDHPGVDGTVDPDLAACRRARAWLPLHRRTPFRAVHRVAPGCLLTVTAGGETEHRYWWPERVTAVRRSPAEWTEAFRAGLEQAVADALPATGAVGAHLSGGLDSTAVAVLAEAALRRDGRGLAAVWSWAPPPRPGQVPAGQDLTRLTDERWLVALSAAGPGWEVVHVPAQVPDATPADPLRRPVTTWRRESWVAADAAARGVRVLLSGWGGDEAISFNGRNLVPWLVGRGRLPAARRELRQRAAVVGRALTPREELRALAGPVLPAARLLLGRRRADPPGPAAHRRSGAGPFVDDALAGQDRLLGGARSPHDLQLALLRLGHLADRCECWFAGGARAGVEYRFPLLDPRLVELALSAPPACFRDRGWSRIAFRRAVEPFLPPEVVWNPVKDDPVLQELARSTAPAGVSPGARPR